MKTFTHITQTGDPTMVDISSKIETKRTAVASGKIKLPKIVIDQFSNNDIQSKKGPVFHTAIIAATMGVKKTSELIPFCHPITIENIKIHISLLQDCSSALVTCQVSTFGKTGVEMEALTGVQTALLTIYDMCKALSHDMTFYDISLLEKTGGKSDIQNTSKPLYGIVLVGGKSSRMGEDKSKIVYHKEEQATYLAKLLNKNCDKVFYACRTDQTNDPHLQGFEKIVDQSHAGVNSVILNILKSNPNANYLILACDMPFITEESLHTLITHFDPTKTATCYINPLDNMPEPLFAIYTSKAIDKLHHFISLDKQCPRKVLLNSDCKTITPLDTNIIINCNSITDKHQAQAIVEQNK